MLSLKIPFYAVSSLPTWSYAIVISTDFFFNHYTILLTTYYDILSCCFLILLGYLCHLSQSFIFLVFFFFFGLCRRAPFSTSWKRGLVVVHACTLNHFSHVQLFVTPWAIPWAYQAPLSMGFSRQVYWSGLPLPPPGYLPDSGIEHMSSALQVNSLLIEPSGKPLVVMNSLSFVWESLYFVPISEW